MTASVPDESNQGVESRARCKFPRAGRLLRHADFERVYKQGKRHFSNSMTVFYLQRQPDIRSTAGLRIGFTVGRAMGGAVQRNRIKRRLREAIRLTRSWSGCNADVVINPKKTVLKADFEELLNEVRQAFVVIERKLSVVQPEDSEKRGSRSPKAEA